MARAYVVLILKKYQYRFFLLILYNEDAYHREENYEPRPRAVHKTIDSLGANFDFRQKSPSIMGTRISVKRAHILRNIRSEPTHARGAVGERAIGSRESVLTVTLRVPRKKARAELLDVCSSGK